MSRNRFELIYTALLVPLDAIMLFLAFWSAYLIRFTGIITFSSIMPKDEYFRLVFLAIPIFIILFAFHKLYSFKKRPFVEELASIILAISTALAVIFAIFFFAKLVFFSRLIIVFAWFLAIIFVIIGRLIAKIIQKNLFYQCFQDTIYNFERARPGWRISVCTRGPFLLFLWKQKNLLMPFHKPICTGGRVSELPGL